MGEVLFGNSLGPLITAAMANIVLAYRNVVGCLQAAIGRTEPEAIFQKTSLQPSPAFEKTCLGACILSKVKYRSYYSRCS